VLSGEAANTNFIAYGLTNKADLIIITLIAPCSCQDIAEKLLNWL
jgi:hypothetical protein